MLALAEFVMRSRINAALVAVLGMIFPIGAWLSCAVVALVLLRKGAKEFLAVAGLAAAVGIYWWFYYQSGVLWMLLGVSALALILRFCASWQMVLLASILVGAISALLIYYTQAKILDDLVLAFIEVYAANAIVIKPGAQTFLRYLVLGAFAVAIQLAVITSLILARYWQAALYNKGGFGQEFRSFRLNFKVALLLLGIVIFEQFLSSFYQVQNYVSLAFIVRIPLILAALAMAHGLVYSKRWHLAWLILFYVAALTPVSILLCAVAVLDSVFDIRRLEAVRT